MNDRAKRFPGIGDGWARFDGPAGTQMVDTAISAMADWAASGNNANSGGVFAGAEACDALLDDTRRTAAAFLGADPDALVFGANMTTITMAFTRAVGQTLGPGDRVVGTRLDHDANVASWRIACERAGAEHVLAPFDPNSGLLDPQAVVDLIDERTRWVAVTGASNLIGSLVDLGPIMSGAPAAGARVYVDAVHLAPHRPIDVRAIGCDALVTSAYKWYGPHAAVLCSTPDLLDALPVAKVRPTPDTGPRRWETGTPNFEAIASLGAAAQYLLDETVAAIALDEAEVCGTLLEGLAAIPGIRVWGPPTMDGRVPTVAFTVEDLHPDDVAVALAADRIATWAGHSVAVEVVDQLGLAESGGVVRAGVVAYITDDDVQRLLTSVERIASRPA